MMYPWAAPPHLIPASPEQLIEEACNAINRLPDPLPRVLRLAITGSSPAHISKMTGLSMGRVEQLRSAFARHIERAAGA
jgi:DNA-directed RNA polymerase specialized sigma24 family protein